MLKDKNRLIVSLAFNKLADLLVSAKVTLPALLISLGAPGWMIMWLVPIRESGALLPQAFVGLYLRKRSARHNVWRVGLAVQISAVCSMLFAALLLDGITAGAVILAALILLSIGRSASSLTVKDIEANVSPKGERGRLVGLASTASGVMTLCAAVPLVYFEEQLEDYSLFILLICSVLAFGVALFSMFTIKTYVETDEFKDKSVFNWRFDNTVYRFIFVRGLFVNTALVAPYFMLESSQNAKSLLPYYLAVQALASMLSSFIWGAIADKSARYTLQLSGVLALLACVGLLSMQPDSLWLSATLFFILSIAHAGVRTGRKTYSLDIKDGQERTELVGFSNTAIGLILLGFGGFYALTSSLIDFSVVYIMTAIVTLAICTTLVLPKEK
ncbi:MFS transporter [Alteromonas sp. 1_MG-2023]|uniref:MFS transporter n=1 Tax=Alteromonas sp. 1_MG-2023 TaxID=3062669 RepID=UPI0026E3AE51|nr:MFS transporter [Alteromonas sp. 1_MG-2023]MDO6567536.1 MFS transporter [Alteromonas sp. 1_MG-2023]